MSNIDHHTYAQLAEYLRDMASRGDDTAKRLLVEISENEVTA